MSAMINRLASIAALTLALCVAPVAQAAERTFFAEFQAICIANLQNLNASRQTALARGFAALSDQPEVVRLAEGNAQFVALSRSVDTPPNISPPFNLKLCMLAADNISDADLKAIGEWAATPAIEADGAVNYWFRIEGSRHVAMSGDQAALTAGLKLGPVYNLEVRRDSDFSGVTLSKMTPRP